jgi:hypothetical protein
MENFYTYQYIRKDGTPYYVGKGSKYRATVKQGRPCGIPTSKHRILIQYWESESEAFEMEMWWIRFWGRKDLGTGILQNKSDGGEGRSNPSEELRQKQIARQTGRVASDEQKRKASESNKGKHVVSEETRRKLSEATKRQPKKTHCKWGHEFTVENTYIWSGNAKRMCRTCSAERQRKYTAGLGGRSA